MCAVCGAQIWNIRALRPRWHAAWTLATRKPTLIDALWLTGPNHSRLENMEEIVHAIEGGVGTLRGIACEKPLARNVAEAKRMVALMQRTGVAHGYLENQVFAPQIETGRSRLW